MARVGRSGCIDRDIRAAAALLPASPAAPLFANVGIEPTPREKDAP